MLRLLPPRNERPSENLTGVLTVCKPEEAIECFLHTKMDALVIGNYLVRK